MPGLQIRHQRGHVRDVSIFGANRAVAQASVPRRRSRSPHKRAPAGPSPPSAAECLIYRGSPLGTHSVHGGCEHTMLQQHCRSRPASVAHAPGAVRSFPAMASRFMSPASHGFPASTRRQRRRGDDRAPSAASRSSTGRADECRRAVAVVAVIVHGPAGPHGGAGAPAERALRTCALGRHAWRPPHHHAVAIAHSACLSRPPERMWTDAACPRPPQGGGTASMIPHETGSTATPGAPRAAPPPRTFGPQGPTLGDLIDAYLQDYQVRQFRSHSTARGRTAHLAAFFGRDARAATLTTYQIRQYQLTPARRRGRHRHHQPGDLGPPSHGHARRPLGLARHRARLPRPPARKSSPPGLFRAPRVSRRPCPPARPVAGYSRCGLLLRLAQE